MCRVPHAPACKTKGRTYERLSLFVLERKTDFRPKHIPRSQSAHYMKLFPQRSLPRYGHHALVCIPMLSTKIRIIFTQFKNAIQAVFCIRNPVYFHPCLSTKSIHLRIAPCRNRRQYWIWKNLVGSDRPITANRTISHNTFPQDNQRCQPSPGEPLPDREVQPSHASTESAGRSRTTAAESR